MRTPLRSWEQARIKIVLSAASNGEGGTLFEGYKLAQPFSALAWGKIDRV